MGWTKWRKIAVKGIWFDDVFDYEGPTCYELAIAGPRGGNMKTVYVGETKNEKHRIRNYARHGSHLSDIIDWHLNRGFSLFYHAQAKKSKREAKKMQDNLLLRYDYDWNIQLNINEID